jgi:hypothetical protein
MPSCTISHSGLKICKLQLLAIASLHAPHISQPLHGGNNFLDNKVYLCLRRETTDSES